MPLSPAAVIERLDARVGQSIERASRAHHRRRLARIGRSAQLDPPEDGELWSAGEPRPRDGCQLEVLIDGEQALAAIAEAIASARAYVHIAGWHATPDFRLTRHEGAPSLRDLPAPGPCMCTPRSGSSTTAG